MRWEKGTRWYKYDEKGIPAIRQEWCGGYDNNNTGTGGGYNNNNCDSW